MRTIPITPGELTGNVLEACHRRYLKGTDLAAWGDALLTAGFDSEAIIEAVANPNMHGERVSVVFSRMCREVGLSDDVANEVAVLKQEVMIEEYRHGLRQAAELLQRFDDLRKRIGFPEPVYLRIMPDNDDGTNDSGYYASQTQKRGVELDALIRKYLEKAGIRGAAADTAGGIISGLAKVTDAAARLSWVVNRQEQLRGRTASPTSR